MTAIGVCDACANDAHDECCVMTPPTGPEVVGGFICTCSCHEPWRTKHKQKEDPRPKPALDHARISRLMGAYIRPLNAGSTIICTQCGRDCPELDCGRCLRCISDDLNSLNQRIRDFQNWLAENAYKYGDGEHEELLKACRQMTRPDTHST